MTQKEEANFVKQAFQALIERKVAKPECFTPSPVTEEDLAAFERRFQITLPSLLKTFLKTYCYSLDNICAPVPEDIDPETIQSDEFSMHLLWLDLLSVPKENPLKDLYCRMECFRSVAVDELDMALESVAHLLPVGDWYAGAGPLCIDLTVPEDKVDLNDMDTWSLEFFDHEEFDWEKCYMHEDGLVRGRIVAPDFKSLLEWYFYGKFDKAYEMQKNEKPDYSKFLE